MKCLLKILCFIGGIILIAKLVQIAIDVLYDNCGKKYISSEEIQ